MKMYLTPLLLLSGCTLQPGISSQPEKITQPVPPSRDRMHSQTTSSNATKSYLERDINRAFGEKAIEAARKAQTSILLRWNVGLPNPNNPASNTSLRAAVSTPRGWMVWQGAEPRMLPADVGQRLTQILNGSDLWREPGSAPAKITCTDSGGLELIIRHRGNSRSNRLGFCDARWKTNAALGLTLLREKVNPAY